MKVTRFHDTPLIHSGLHPSIGDNINGPCLIQVPEWVSNPLGRYYLYFAHHKGRSIRLAFADQLTGPWQVHEPGALALEDSFFAQSDLAPGRSIWGAHSSDDDHVAHIASPDVIIDHGAKLFRMYFHGLLEDGDQQTRLAISTDGLTFTTQPQLLGPPYFRVFDHGGFVYAVSWGGICQRSNDWAGPFETGQRLLNVKADGKERTIRHVAVFVKGDMLNLFFSCIGDCPEAILVSQIDLTGDWRGWSASEPKLLLEPKLAWEGALLQLEPSKVGTSLNPEHALRDPYVFESDGEYYILYTGSGEQGIGIARLEF